MTQMPCQKCGKILPESWTWHKCDMCGYRICDACFQEYKHDNILDGGPFIKCGKCGKGFMKKNVVPKNKL